MRVYTEATPRLIEFHKKSIFSRNEYGHISFFDNTDSDDQTGVFNDSAVDEKYYIDHGYTKLSEQEFIEFMELEETKQDNVNKPSHYAQGGIEPIDYILANEMNFLEGNVIKYVTRYKHKNGLEDLKKAEFYLKKLIEGYK